MVGVVPCMWFHPCYLRLHYVWIIGSLWMIATDSHVHARSIFFVVYAPEISGSNPRIASLWRFLLVVVFFFWKPMFVCVHRSGIVWIICTIQAFCMLYVFPKSITCCLNYSNQMLSNMKLIVNLLCHVPELPVQSTWTTPTNLNGMIDPLNSNKASKLLRFREPK